MLMLRHLSLGKFFLEGDCESQDPGLLFVGWCFVFTRHCSLLGTIPISKQIQIFTIFELINVFAALITQEKS